MSSKKKFKKTKKQANIKGDLPEIKRKLSKLFRYDPRGSHSEGASLVSLNVNEALPISVRTDANYFYSTIFASISYALSRGWSANVKNDSYPYFAWVYMGRALVLFAQGGTVETGNVPKWFALLIQAVIKTEANLGSGKIQYQFDVVNDANEVWLTGIGPAVYGRAYNLGRKDTSVLVNGNIPTIVSPTPYTTDGGVAAVQSLWVFLSGVHKNDPMHAMVPMNEHNSLTKDVSAFAVNEVWPGNGIYNSGGYARRSTLEVGIPRPEFSVFSVKPSTSTAFTNRFPRKVVNYAGDAFSLGASVCFNLTEKQLLRRTPPNIKFVDFCEYLNVLFNFCQMAVQKEVETSFFLDGIEKDPGYFDQFQCPLTLQECALMHRQAVLSTNVKDQIAYQALYPRLPTSANDVEFVSYVAGQGTVPVPNTSMPMIPMLLKENVNSLRGATVNVRGDKTTNPLSWYTVWGEYFGTSFSRDEYLVSYEIGGEIVTQYVFADDTGEIPISRVDGGYGMGSYAMINDPSYINELVAMWNKWIAGLTNTVRALSTFGADNGIAALYMTGITRYWINQKTVDEKEEDEEIDITAPPIKMSKKDREIYAEFVLRQRKTTKEFRLDVGPYADRAYIAYTANYIIFKQPWQTIQQFWIAPCIKMGSQSSENDTTGTYMQGAQYNEPRSIVPAQGSAFFPTLAASHLAYAALMIKAPFADEAEWQEVMIALSEQGEAGILGTIGGALIQQIGTAGVQVAGQLVQQLVPF